MFFVFVMFEIISKEDTIEDSRTDKWGQIFGMALVWMLFVGLIFAFTSPAGTTVTAVTYSGAGIK